MSFQTIVSKPYVLRLIVSLVVVTLTLIGVGRYFFASELGGFWLDFLDSLFNGIFTSSLIGIYLKWISPEAETVNTALVETVEPRDLPDLFDHSLSVSNIWLYKGATGRYFRTRTLPAMAEHARHDSLSRQVVGIVIDPTDRNLCQEYANYRNGTKSASIEGKWSVYRVQEESIATILTALHYSVSESLLRVRVGVSKSFSVFRIDIGSNYAILTRENRLAPAITCRESTYYYRSFVDEIHLFESQHLMLQEPAKLFPLASLTSEEIINILDNAGLDLGGFLLPEESTESIMRILKEQRNPYE